MSTFGLAVWVCLLVLAVAPASAQTLLDAAFARAYNSDFAGARLLLDERERQQPGSPLTPSTRAAVELFAELDRLGILRSEFFLDKGDRLKRRELRPSAEVRDRIFGSLQAARDLADRRLADDPRDTDALFSLVMAAGVECNYAVFVDKRRMSALPLAKSSHNLALRLIDLNPGYHDAYLIPALNEYMVATLPFFVRWFVQFERVDGDKVEAGQRLRQVAESGRYFGPFARILLAAIHLREKEYEDSYELVESLARDFPENPLFRAELARLRDKLARRERAG